MLIGIASGCPLVGKTTCSDYLVDKYDFISIEMSLPVMFLANHLFGYDLVKKPKDSKNRKILQTVGYLMKQIEPTYWLYLALNLVSRYRKRDYNYNINSLSHEAFTYSKTYFCSNFNNHFKENNIVICGIRSKQEVEEIQKMNGKVFFIKRKTDEVNNHPVETDLNDFNGFDEIIDNNSTIDDFYKKIDFIIKKDKNE